MPYLRGNLHAHTTFSDGVPDAVNAADESYGTGRLEALLETQRGGTAQQVCDAVFADVFAFRGAAAAFDDITVLVMRAEAKA